VNGAVRCLDQCGLVDLGLATKVGFFPGEKPSPSPFRIQKTRSSLVTPRHGDSLS
jgi:hypothetical protein